METQPPVLNVVFAGTPDFSVPSLHALNDDMRYSVSAVITQPDKPVGRHQQLTPPPVKIFAEEHNLPVMQPKSIRAGTFRSQLSTLDPDVVVIVAYGKIVPEKLLGIPAHGWVNVHASLLPKHRGASPIHSAILHGDAKTGVTIMQLDAGMDTGPIISQKTISIPPDATAATLHDTLSDMGAGLLLDTLYSYCRGAITSEPQDETHATISPRIDKTDGRINWQLPADTIDRAIRAYTPWPGSYTFLGDRRLEIISAAPAPSRSSLQPGRIQLTPEGLFIGTATVPLQVDTIKPAGKKTMSGSDFAHGLSRDEDLRVH